MKNLHPEFRLIRETYLFDWDSTETYVHPTFGLVNDEWDMFMVEIRYYYVGPQQTRKMQFIKLHDRWTSQKEIPSRAVHFQRVADAIGFRLVPENLFSKTYEFSVAGKTTKALEVEIKVKEGVFIKTEETYFEKYSIYKTFMEFVLERVGELQEEISQINP